MLTLLLVTALTAGDTPQYLHLSKPKVYVAVDNDVVGSQLRSALTMNYVACGSDTVWYDLDARRNGLYNDLDIILVPEKDLPPVTPAISINGHEWVEYPDAKPDLVLWLDVFEEIQRDWTYHNRHEKWKWLKRQHQDLIYMLDSEWYDFEWGYGSHYLYNTYWGDDDNVSRARDRMNRIFPFEEPAR